MMDFDKPYGTVYETPGVRYQQNGKYYRGDGSPLVAEPEERFEEPDQAGAPKLGNNGWTEDDLRRPENKSLKAQLDVYNEPWTTRKAALAFLDKGARDIPE